MKKLTLLISVLMIITSINVIGQPYNDNQDLIQNDIVDQPSLYRISPPILMDDLPRTAEIVGGNPGSYHDVIMDEKSIYILQEKGYHPFLTLLPITFNRIFVTFHHHPR